MKRLFFKSLVVSVVLGIVAFEYMQLPDISLLKRRNPRSSALMDLRDKEYRRKGLNPARQQIWVPYKDVSDHLKKAILISEDAAFFSHNGVDFFELKEALKKDWQTGQLKRGGSTITMQLARNLYLSPSKDPLRKLREIAIAFRLEQTLPKTRIFELYLNVVEWGRNIYGAEAASRHYLFKSASALDPADAATLAALLPSPRNPGEKSLIYRRNLILSRLASIGYISADDADRESRQPLFFRYKEEEMPGPQGEPLPEEENSY